MLLRVTQEVACNIGRPEEHNGRNGVVILEWRSDVVLRRIEVRSGRFVGLANLQLVVKGNLPKSDACDSHVGSQKLLSQT